MIGEPTSKQPSDPGRMQAIVRRRYSKAVAAFVVSGMIENWICDGCAVRDDGDYDIEQVEKEARRLKKQIEARYIKLSLPNV